MNATELVRVFIDAFNAEDLDALGDLLSDDVEIQASRGLVGGREQARRWATRNPSGELHQRLVLDDVEDLGAHAIATVRRQWYWRESGETADEHRLHYVATLRDGMICRWAPFETLADARRAAGAN